LKENISLADNEVEIDEIEGRRLVGIRGTVFSIEHLVNYGILERGDKDEFVGSFNLPREAIAGPVLF
jgi:DMSO/TMAO reductase YedYZ heme-binding membrane subunit